MNKTEILFRLPWLMSVLVIISMISGHLFYLRIIEWSIQINLSGTEGKFYQQHPSLCAYDWSPDPQPCYILSMDFMSIMLFGIFGLAFYIILFQRRI